ncbi:hypothetical protein GN956_G14793 [Arapaima gigas]
MQVCSTVAAIISIPDTAPVSQSRITNRRKSDCCSAPSTAPLPVPPRVELLRNDDGSRCQRRTWCDGLTAENMKIV